ADAEKANHGKSDKLDGKALPDTGDNDQINSTLFGSLFAALGGLFLVGKRRKNNNKEEK
ncbi:LPXTG cell wall anchor domain-containing protein, partial [Staphylococcus aureus]|nr:LPXTG cell wall anchor domain-containing protein [Staphylococcus aureus]